MLRIIFSALGAIGFLAFLIRLRIILDNPEDDRFPVMGRCSVCAKRIFIWHRVIPRKVMLLFYQKETGATIKGCEIGTMGHVHCTSTMPVNVSVMQKK